MCSKRGGRRFAVLFDADQKLVAAYRIAGQKERLIGTEAAL
jgi:hypothetical protein